MSKKKAVFELLLEDYDQKFANKQFIENFHG